MKLLLDLPTGLIDNIIFFLPQQETINLSLTNYQFYQPCLKKLYQKITIRIDAVLKANSGKTRGIDFSDSTQSVIYGFNKITSEDHQFKLINARLKALIISISINIQLLEYIEEITIFGSFDSHINETLMELMWLLAKSSLKKLVITDPKLRHDLKGILTKGEFKNLQLITIDSVKDLSMLEQFLQVSELIVAFIDPDQEKMQIEQLEVSPILIKQLQKLKSITVASDNKIYFVFVCLLNHIYKKIPFKLNLTTFTLNYYHRDIALINRFINSPVINWGTINNIQISLGCDDKQCNQECLANFGLPVNQLKKISLLQNSEAEIDTHKYNELWDIKIVGFLQEIDTSCLKYLSIGHNPCERGVFVDGMEGNYLQRIKLYTETLPTTIDSKQVVLILPNFFKSLSCYEQPMNNILWNGCKCDHCKIYLEKLDEFLMMHKYYNLKSHHFKDLTSSNLFVTIGEWLSRRYFGCGVVSGLDYLKYPLNNVRWNFHDTMFSIPLRCLNHKNYEEHEFDEDVDVDVFYDAGSEFEKCSFDEHLYRPVCSSISHYTDNIIIKISDLNRGNAEDLEPHKFDDLNDGSGFDKWAKVSISGICYNLDKELNGTNYFENVYD